MRLLKKNFCDISPAAYAISEENEILKRKLSDALAIRKGRVKFAETRQKDLLPVLISSHDSGMIKKGPGIEPELQENKAVNIRLASAKLDGLIIQPGETFSFWRTIGRTTRRKGYKDGRVIIANRLRPGVGGGLCNLGNTIHLLALYSPLTVTEMHTHSDALAPDEGPRKPFATGTSVAFNYIDLRFRNDTDQPFQLHVWTENGRSYAQLLSMEPCPYTYELTEEGHRFQKEGEKYYRVGKIYRVTKEKATDKVLDKQLIRDNHSEVMYDYSLIPDA